MTPRKNSRKTKLDSKECFVCLFPLNNCPARAIFGDKNCYKLIYEEFLATKIEGSVASNYLKGFLMFFSKIYYYGKSHLLTWY